MGETIHGELKRELESYRGLTPEARERIGLCVMARVMQLRGIVSTTHPKLVALLRDDHVFRRSFRAILPRLDNFVWETGAANDVIEVYNNWIEPILVVLLKAEYGEHYDV